MKKSYYKNFIFVLVIVALLFAINYFSKNKILDLTYTIIEKPGSNLQRSINGLALRWRSLINAPEIMANDKALIDENNTLKSRILALENLQKENEFLRKQLDVAAPKTRQLLLADIINVDQDALSSSILINKGSADGVKEKSAVISAGNVFVGTVSQVFDHSALVILPDDSRSLIQIKIDNPEASANKNILASAKGGNEKGKFGIDLVTNQDKIDDGDLISTSGFDGLPSGLLVGNILNAQGGSDLFQNVKAGLIFSPWANTQVFIIIP